MNQENITRTLATGQSDITRHEAYTKAQGLNWANANAPKYVAADKFNGHEYVDLGLPSGTLWATMNIGATSETDLGSLFAWGEVESRSDDDAANPQDYKFFVEDEEYTKYNNTDNLTVLELEDDAAHINWGGEWHMATASLVDELANSDYCDTDHVSQGNYDIMIVTSKINGNSVKFIKEKNSQYSWINEIADGIWGGSTVSDYLVPLAGLEDRYKILPVRPVIGEIAEVPK